MRELSYGVNSYLKSRPCSTYALSKLWIYICHSMSKRNPYIRLGASFELFYTGFFLMLLVPLLAFLFHPILWILIIPVISVFRSAKGVEFDVPNYKVKLYYNFLGFRIGSWVNYMPNDELWLHKSGYFERVSFRTERFSRDDTWSYYFDVYLIRQNGDNVEIGSFSSYLEAHAFLLKWSEILGLKAVDHFDAELLESIERNRSGRRR